MTLAMRSTSSSSTNGQMPNNATLRKVIWMITLLVTITATYITLHTTNSIKPISPSNKTTSTSLSSSPPPPPAIRQSRRRRLEIDETTTVAEDEEQTWPEVAWLMAFPESGTGYTTRLIHYLSDTCMATNYGPELSDSYKTIPLVAATNHGPYRYNNRPFPPRYILTKTFCMGFCLGCEVMYTKTTADFIKGCSLGNGVNDENSPGQVHYDESLVKKVVHLVRNPFDNIVVRFHADFKKYKPHPENYDMGEKVWKMKFNPQGFRKWCKDVDDASLPYEPRLQDPKISDLVQGIPCYSQFYQYVHWHNKAFDATAEYRIPFIVIHYDNFRDDIEGVISTMFDFLELPVTGTIPPFPYQRFLEFFSKDERVAISSFIKVLASQPTWMEIKRYLPPPIPSDQFNLLGTTLSVYHGSWPQIAWLISYPNSGTYYTTQLAQVGSQMTTATNYLPETGDRYLDIPNYSYGDNGPYRTSKRLLPDKFVLTKTHCLGHKYEPGPDDILTTPLEFMRGCASGVGLVNEKRISVRYKPDEAKRVVHLIRNPFDNVVARFHYLYKLHNSQHAAAAESGGEESSWNYSHSPAGFRQWCADQDETFKGNKVATFGAEVTNLARGVPCHGEFYQYVQWHNNAFKIPTTLKIPSLLLFYEDYGEDLDKYVKKLFQFLKIKLTGFVTPFHWNGGYAKYYTNEEKVAIVELIKMICTDETCRNLQRYF